MSVVSGSAECCKCKLVEVQSVVSVNPTLRNVVVHPLLVFVVHISMKIYDSKFSFIQQNCQLRNLSVGFPTKK